MWLIGAVVPVLLATTLVNMPPLTECAPNPPVSERQYWFRATQVVVEPWRGPHHVYGTFSVPEQYRRHRLYTAKLMITGIAEDGLETSPEAGTGLGGRVDPWQYAMQLYLPTRMAIWALLTGRFGDLNASCHWWLVLTEKVRQG